MAYKTQYRLLPSISGIDDIRSVVWAKDLIGIINIFMREVYDDITQGNIKHKNYTTTPLASDVSEGEIVLSHEGTNYYLYAKVDGQLKKVTLT